MWQGFIDLVNAASASTMPADWPRAQTHDHEFFRLPDGFTTDHRSLQDLEEGSLEWVQMNLNTLGVPNKLLAVDGQDSQGTQDALAAFQARKGLTATGVIDPGTISALKSGRPANSAATVTPAAIRSAEQRLLLGPNEFSPLDNGAFQSPSIADSHRSLATTRNRNGSAWSMDHQGFNRLRNSSTASMRSHSSISCRLTGPLCVTVRRSRRAIYSMASG